MKVKEAFNSYKRCTELNPKNEVYFEKAARTLSFVEGEAAALPLYKECVKIADSNGSNSSSG